MNVNTFKVCPHLAKVKFCIILKCNTQTSSFRCIAVCSLGLWVCEELMQKNIHQQVKDAISVLGVTLKVSNPIRKKNLCLLWLYNFCKRQLHAYF